MNFQRITALVGKDLKGMLREPAMLFLIILFPVMLTLAFGVSFGAIGGTQPTTFQIGLINMDSSGSYLQYSQSFIGNLTSKEILKVQARSQ